VHTTEALRLEVWDEVDAPYHTGSDDRQPFCREVTNKYLPIHRKQVKVHFSIRQNHIVSLVEMGQCALPFGRLKSLEKVYGGAFTIPDQRMWLKSMIAPRQSYSLWTHDSISGVYKKSTNAPSWS